MRRLRYFSKGEQFCGVEVVIGGYGSSVVAAKTFPIHKNPEQHPETEPCSDAIVDITAFARANARVKRNGTFQNAQACGQSAVEKIGVEDLLELMLNGDCKIRLAQVQGFADQ